MRGYTSHTHSSFSVLVIRLGSKIQYIRGTEVTLFMTLKLLKTRVDILFLQKTLKIVQFADSQWAINLWVWLTPLCGVIFYCAQSNRIDLVSIIRSSGVSAV